MLRRASRTAPPDRPTARGDAALAKILLTPLTLAAALALAACASPEPLEQVERPANILYDEALILAADGEADKAAPKFEEVERQHPYSDLAVRAQVMAAWSFYQANDYARAVAALDRFIELYPAESLVEYAYYLKALCYYEQIVDVERDAEMTLLALNAFEDMLRRYPDGFYSRDGRLKADLARSHLAGKEMAVGRFYSERGHYSAALRRFEGCPRLPDKQSDTEALYRMVEAYLALGLIEEADNVGSVAVLQLPRLLLDRGVAGTGRGSERALPRGMFQRTIETVSDLFDR